MAISTRQTGPVVRPAEAGDAAALARIDAATWSPDITPAPRWDADADFFAGCEVGDVLVAQVEGRVVGYVRVTPSIPLPSAAHVQEVRGLAVDPRAQGSGVGRVLLAAARELAVRRSARKLVLRVLDSNRGALALYRSAGYEVEGVLKGLFLLGGRYVDDVLMALDLR